MSFTYSVSKRKSKTSGLPGINRASRGVVIKTAVMLTHKADEPTKQERVPRNRLFWVWKIKA